MGWLQFTPSQYYLLTTQDGRTALMLAAMGGYTLTLKALIGGGAYPNIPDRVSGSDYSTPEMWIIGTNDNFHNVWEDRCIWYTCITDSPKV